MEKKGSATVQARIAASRLDHSAKLAAIEKNGSIELAKAEARGGAKKPAGKKPAAKKPAARKSAVKKGGDLFSAMDKIPEAAKGLIKLTNTSAPAMTYTHETGRTPPPGGSTLVNDCAHYMLSKLDVGAILEEQYTQNSEDPWTKEEFAAIPREQLDRLIDEYREELLIDFKAECLRQRRNGELTPLSFDRMLSAEKAAAAKASKKKSRKSRLP